MRAVRVLCEVAEQGSFSAAARSLGMTQSAVSQHVAGLEREVGLPLVERGTRPLELTEAGAVVVRHGRAIATHLGNAEHALDEISGRLAGRLRVGSFPTALTTFVPSAIARFREEAPEVVLTMVDDHMQGLVPRLEHGELDLAVIYENPVLPGGVPAGLELVPLFDDPYRVLLPERHRLARRRNRLRLTDLAEDAWVGGRVGSTWFRILLHACRTAGFEPRTQLATDDYRAVQAFVAAGLGVAVVPGLAATNPLPGVEVRDLAAGGPVRRIGVAHLSGTPSVPVRAMTAILRDVTGRGARPRA
ncbi:LysR family transcriptional regulator [Nocardioides sp. SR21]|uniref:LysR family transcriptional regulator n=1 Tax=Nocardioides sp. SR21 TaxID=2919501 RepID=UPI001FAB1F57|nr:LysR family transcriptional regulator [Nocardioides sp. SR21]